MPTRDAPGRRRKRTEPSFLRVGLPHRGRRRRIRQRDWFQAYGWVGLGAIAVGLAVVLALITRLTVQALLDAWEP